MWIHVCTPNRDIDMHINYLNEKYQYNENSGVLKNF